jgi:23S rRNA pseudouridine2605 synthase
MSSAALFRRFPIPAAFRTPHSDGSSAKIPGGSGCRLTARRRADDSGRAGGGQRRDVRELGTRVDPGPRPGGGGRQADPGEAQALRGAQQAAGLVCSRKDEFERPTIYGLLPKEWGHLHSVGRLDYNSEGLIFLTNDGEFSLRLTHPRYGVRKKYVATVEGRVAAEMLTRFTRGGSYQGDKLKAEKARLVSASQAQSVVELELAQGKYREVRRLFESQQVTVKRLQRVQIGKDQAGRAAARQMADIDRTGD